MYGGEQTELENFFGSDPGFLSVERIDNKQLQGSFLPLHHHLLFSLHIHYIPHNMSAEKKGRTIFIGNIPYGSYDLRHVLTYAFLTHTTRSH